GRGAIGDHEAAHARLEQRAHDPLRGAACAEEEHAEPPQLEPEVRLQVGDQADAVGGIAKSVLAEDERVDRLREARALACAIAVAKRLALEGKRDVEALSAGTAKALHGGRERLERRLDAGVLDVLAAGTGELAMDARRQG